MIRSHLPVEHHVRGAGTLLRSRETRNQKDRDTKTQGLIAFSYGHTGREGADNSDLAKFRLVRFRRPDIANLAVAMQARDAIERRLAIAGGSETGVG